MEKAVPSRSEMLLKWVSLISLVLSAAWTLYTYGVDRAKQQNASIFERQTSLYFEAARNAAIIAASNDPALKSAAEERFNQLYFGELVIVEDRRIELAMIAFFNCKNASDKDCARRARIDEKGNPLAATDVQRQFDSALLHRSLELAACIRTALEQNRGIVFSNRVNPKTTCPYD